MKIFYLLLLLSISSSGICSMRQVVAQKFAEQFVDGIEHFAINEALIKSCTSNLNNSIHQLVTAPRGSILKKFFLAYGYSTATFTVEKLLRVPSFLIQGPERYFEWIAFDFGCNLAGKFTELSIIEIYNRKSITHPSIAVLKWIAYGLQNNNMYSTNGFHNFKNNNTLLGKITNDLNEKFYKGELWNKQESFGYNLKKFRLALQGVLLTRGAEKGADIYAIYNGEKQKLERIQKSQNSKKFELYTAKTKLILMPTIHALLTLGSPFIKIMSWWMLKNKFHTHIWSRVWPCLVILRTKSKNFLINKIRRTS